MSTDYRFEAQLHLRLDEEERAGELWEEMFFDHDTMEWWTEPTEENPIGCLYLATENSYSEWISAEDRLKRYLLALRETLGRPFESDVYVYYVEQIPYDSVYTGDTPDNEWDWLEEEQVEFLRELRHQCAEPGPEGVEGPLGPPEREVVHNPHTVILEWIREQNVDRTGGGEAGS
jgi:hypothetical protein